MERQGRLRPNDGGSGCRARRGADCDDRRYVSKSSPNSGQHRREQGERGRLNSLTKGGMNTKLHSICDCQGRPLYLSVNAGQISDYIGARALLSSLPEVDRLLGDRSCDADCFREALKDRGIRAGIPDRKQRKKPVKCDKRRYKRRNRIEVMYGRF